MMENLQEKFVTAELSKYLSSAEELIEEARNGRMFILVDDEDRENEGDLVVPAQFATPDAINFMARHARGLICLALTRARVEKLGLPLMSQQNGTRHQTAFTVSIEAREGVTTGISAADRAKTIAVAINPESTPRRYHHAGPRVSAAGPGRRHAGSRRPYRGFGRYCPQGRTGPGRGDLRDHERRRHHGTAAGPSDVRAAP